LGCSEKDIMRESASNNEDVKVDLVFFKESNGKVPTKIWLDRLPDKVYTKCLGRLELLEDWGHQLSRPHAGFLRDGIHELRLN